MQVSTVSDHEIYTVLNAYPEFKHLRQRTCEQLYPTRMIPSRQARGQEHPLKNGPLSSDNWRR